MINDFNGLIAEIRIFNQNLDLFLARNCPCMNSQYCMYREIWSVLTHKERLRVADRLNQKKKEKKHEIQK